MRMTGRRLGGCIFLALFAVCTPVFAQEKILSMTASVDAREIGTLDTLTLTVTVETENITRLNKPELPTLTGFSVIHESSNSQTSISIVNGKTTRSKTRTFSYVLKPDDAGEFTINPVTLRYGGKTYRTDPIRVTVKEGRVRQEGSAGPGEVQVDPESLKKDIFILVTPEKSTVFEGEQVFLTYTLYSRLDIDSVSLKRNPDYKGFYIDDIYNATRLEYRKETYQDRIYTTSLLKKVALFPLRSGTYSPEPLVLESTVILKSRDLFDIFGFPYTFNIESNDVSITVKPRPALGSGSSFSGVVGSLEAEIQVPDKSVRTGESVLCYLTLKSTGNLSMITDPALKLSLAGRTYLSDTILDTVEEESGIFFVKKFEYTIIPEERGSLTVEGPDLLYFDSEEKSYALMTPAPVQISVSGENIIREKPIREQKRRATSGSLQFIKKDLKSLKSMSPSPFQTSFFYVYHLGLLVVVFGLFIYRMQKEKLVKNFDMVKRRRARSNALRMLDTVDGLLEERRESGAVDAVYRSLVSYLADKTGQRIQEISSRRITDMLTTIPGIERDLAERTSRTLRACTEAKFATGEGKTVFPTGPENRIRDLKNSVSRIIDEIETAGGR
jgi:hypothetical protein